MQDARPQQSLCYEINIKITGSDASTPKKYSWVEVYRDSSGIWNELKRAGSFTLDPAYEVNNAAVVSGMICPARRDQRTGSLLFVTRSSSASAPSSPSCPIKLLASFEFYGTGDGCSEDWVWGSGKDPTGNFIPQLIPCEAAWGIGHINQGKFGMASFDYIEFQYMKLHQSTWTTAKRLIPGTDPDPRATPYSWTPPIYPVRIRVVAKIAKVAVGIPTDFGSPPAYYVYASTVSDLQTPDTLPDGKPNEIWIYSTDVGSTKTLSAKTDLIQPDHSTAKPVEKITVSFGGFTVGAAAISNPTVFPSAAVGSASSALNNSYVQGIGVCYYYGVLPYFSSSTAIATVSGGTNFGYSVSGTAVPSPIGSSIFRTRWGTGPDSYGVGNYIDLRYYRMSATGGIQATASDTPTHTGQVTGFVSCTCVWNSGPEPTTSPPAGCSQSYSTFITERSTTVPLQGIIYNFPTSTGTASISVG